MSFESIATGTTVFVDANVFVYAFSGDRVFGNACLDLLERVELGDLGGCLSAAVLGEVAHRLMTLEACQRYGWPYPRIGQRLRQHPREVQQLKTFRAALDEIVAIGLRIFDVGVANVIRAADLSIQHGLLSNDALVVAMMEQQGVRLRSRAWDRAIWTSLVRLVGGAVGRVAANRACRSLTSSGWWRNSMSWCRIGPLGEVDSSGPVN